MAYTDIKVEKKGGVVLLTLNRPDRLNAVTWNSWREIEQVVQELKEDDEARVLVVTGSGRGFSAGTDLAAAIAGAGEPPPGANRSERLRSRFLGAVAVLACPKPSIAAVNGVAAGAGLSICLAVKVSFVVGRPSRFIKPPGNLPAELSFSR